MSDGPRTLIGILMGFGALFAFVAGLGLGDQLPRGAAPLYGVGAFFAVASIACLSKRGRPIALRLIGGVISVTYFVYAASTIGEPRFFRAAVGCVIFGVPAGWLAVTGKFPDWGFAAAAFNSTDDEEGRPRRKRKKRPRSLRPDALGLPPISGETRRRRR